MKDLTPVSQDIASQIQTAKKLSQFESTQILEDLRQWPLLLARPSASPDRKLLKEWSESNYFDNACKIFSDSGGINEAYKFLESVNQNPDSKILLRSCKNFLDVH